MTGNTNVVGNPLVGHVHVSVGEEDSQTDQDRVAIPLRGEDALRGLLQVDPQAEPAEDK